MSKQYRVVSYLNGDPIDEVFLDENRILDWIKFNSDFVSMFKVYVVEDVDYSIEDEEMYL